MSEAHCAIPDSERRNKAVAVPAGGQSGWSRTAHVAGWL